jgi:hypothetical protein
MIQVFFSDGCVIEYTSGWTWKRISKQVKSILQDMIWYDHMTHAYACVVIINKFGVKPVKKFEAYRMKGVNK